MDLKSRTVKADQVLRAGARAARGRTLWVGLAAGLALATGLGLSGEPSGSALGQGPAGPSVEVPPLGGKTAAESRDVQITHCQITLLEQANVPATEAGVISQIEIRPGSYVERGQELARLDEQKQLLEKKQAECDLQATLAELANDVAMRFASKSWEVTRAEWREKSDANAHVRNAVAPQELRRLKLAEERAQLEIEQAEHQRTVQQVHVDSRKAAVALREWQLVQRRIVAPLAGVVAKVERHRGEWVNPGDVVCRIYRLDRLKVEGFLNIKDFGPEVLGSRVTAHVTLPGGKTGDFVGKIVFVAPEVEAQTGDFHIWAEVENRDDLLRPGLSAVLTLHGDDRLVEQTRADQSSK